MVQSEVYLNKYVVSIVLFSTPAFTSTPPSIQKTALFAYFRVLIYHPFFQGGSQLTLFAPMCVRHYIPKTLLYLASFKSRLVLTF